MINLPSPIEGILAVLEEENFTGTNKLGLLLALIELAPLTIKNTLKIETIAEKIIEIHWNHSEVYCSNNKTPITLNLRL